MLSNVGFGNLDYRNIFVVVNFNLPQPTFNGGACA